MRDHLYKEEMERLFKLGLTNIEDTKFCYYRVVEYEYVGSRKIKKDEYGGFDFYIDGVPSSYEHYDTDYGYNMITDITPTLTIPEIIEILPREIYDNDGTTYELKSDFDGVWYISSKGDIAYSNRCSDLMDSLYNILIYLLTNPKNYKYEQIGN